MFPFGAIGAWSKAQRAEWQHSALRVVDTVVTPISALLSRFSKQRQAANTREDIPTMEVENLQRSHQNRKLHENDFDNCDDFDWTFRCLGVRTSLQLRARCHCHLGPWSPNACATLKTSQNAPKNHEMQ